MMFLVPLPKGVRREILFYVPDNKVFSLGEVVEKFRMGAELHDRSLGSPESNTEATERFAWFDQANVRLSRKKIQPLLHSTLQALVEESTSTVNQSKTNPASV